MPQNSVRMPYLPSITTLQCIPYFTYTDVCRELGVSASGQRDLLAFLAADGTDTAAASASVHSVSFREFANRRRQQQKQNGKLNRLYM